METLTGNLSIAKFLGYSVIHNKEEGSIKTINPKGKMIRGVYHFEGSVQDNIENEWGIVTRNLYYHKSWSAIMPVVEKIQTEFDLDCALIESELNSYGLCCKMAIFKSHTSFYYWHGFATLRGGQNPMLDDKRYLCESKLIAVWNAVVEFIEWYNIQTLNQEPMK